MIGFKWFLHDGTDPIADHTYIMQVDKIEDDPDLPGFPILPSDKQDLLIEASTKMLRAVNPGVEIITISGRNKKKKHKRISTSKQAGDYTKSVEIFQESCLVDALRLLGAPVQYSRHGPFAALRDGNEFLCPLGKRLRRVNTIDATRFGKYVIHRDGHFWAFRNHVDECDLRDLTMFTSMTYDDIYSTCAWVSRNFKVFLLENLMSGGMPAEDVAENVFLRDCHEDVVGGMNSPATSGGAAVPSVDIDEDSMEGLVAPAQAIAGFDVDQVHREGVAHEAGSQELEALMEEATLLGSMEALTIVVNQPIAHNHLVATSEGTPVPSDDLCLYHCCTATEDMQGWRSGRKPDGYGANHEQVARDIEMAYQVKKEILCIAIRRGRLETVSRLMLPGGEGHPGLDDMDLIAEYLGGQVVVEVIRANGPVHILYGQGPLVALFRHASTTDGSGAENPNHWLPVQSWRAKPGDGSGRCPPGAAAAPGVGIAPPRSADRDRTPSVERSERKRILDEWEPPEFAELMGEQWQVTVDADIVPEDDNLVALTDQLIARVDTEVGQWTTKPSVKAHRALLIVALCVEEQTTWSRCNDVLVSRIFGLIHRLQFRAHADSIYSYKNGAWLRVVSIPERVMRSTEKALIVAQAMLLRLSRAATCRKWEDVFGVLRAHHKEDEASQISSADFKAPEAISAVWAYDAAKSMTHLSTSYTGKEKGKNVLDCFGAWMQEERVAANGLVNFEDTCLAFGRSEVSGSFRCPRIAGVKKDTMNHCYLHIPVSLTVKASKASVDRLRLYFCTTFAGSPGGRQLDMAMEALAFYGKPLPQRIIMFIGDGGDGKSSRTLLRANVLAGQHAIISPECFQKVDEFRIQGCHFAYVAAVTVQECRPGFGLIEDIWKKFISGEFLACRPLFGKETVYIRWNTCAKYWEVNQCLPSISPSPNDIKAMKAFFRRLLVVKLKASFTSDVNLAKSTDRVFKEDSTLSSFLESPEARLAYMQAFLIPFVQKYSASECVAMLVNPPQSIKDDTLEITRRMANGGLENPTEPIGVPTQIGGPADQALLEARRLVEIAHSITQGNRTNVHVMAKHKDIPGLWSKPQDRAQGKGSGRAPKKTKFQNLEEAMRQWP